MTDGFDLDEGARGQLGRLHRRARGGLGSRVALVDLVHLREVLHAREEYRGLDRLVKTTVFLARMEDFAEMNEVYKRHAGTEPPARSTVQAAKLPAGALVEIEAVGHL